MLPRARISATCAPETSFQHERFLSSVYDNRGAVRRTDGELARVEEAKHADANVLCERERTRQHQCAEPDRDFDSRFHLHSRSRFLCIFIRTRQLMARCGATFVQRFWRLALPGRREREP